VCSDPTLTLSDCQFLGGTLQPVTDKNTKIGVAAQARLRYKFPRTSVDLSYQRYETSGSGLFAGAQSDIVRADVIRPLSRVWTAGIDIGYSHNSRVQPLTPAQVTQCTVAQSGSSSAAACPANDADTYSYSYAGVQVHRAFGRNFNAFASYQFNDLAFDHSFCPTTSACSRISNRSVFTIGLDWTPRPIRID
jgi:hypothetical protein